MSLSFYLLSACATGTFILFLSSSLLFWVHHLCCCLKLNGLQFFILEILTRVFRWKQCLKMFFGGVGTGGIFWNGGGQGVLFESFLTSDFPWSFYTSLHVVFYARWQINWNIVSSVEVNQGGTLITFYEFFFMVISAQCVNSLLLLAKSKCLFGFYFFSAVFFSISGERYQNLTSNINIV